jgi:aldose sugar dehydrogenase
MSGQATLARPFLHRHCSAARRAAALAAALSLTVTAVASAEVFESEHHAFRLVTVVDGLQHPWGLVFLPGGDMLVTERAGRLRIVRDGALLPDPVDGVPAVQFRGQGGLMDVALHPDFESNNLLYLSYSKPNADNSLATTAVVRGRYQNGALTGVEEIFEAEAWGNSIGHYGSRLAFDHDGYLFITIGDRMAPPTGDLYAHPSQDLTNHQGTIVRLHDDGRVPEDNPFVGRDDVLPEIWSYGHRNQQGLAVHPETGAVWSNEHGPQGGDELNYIEPGLNYGWPVIGHGVQYGSGAQIHEGTHRDGMEQPALYWVPSIAASGLMIYDGDEFPAWRGSVFSGGMSAQHQVLSRAVVEGSEVVHEELLLPGELRIRDVRQGPDGYIYLAVDHRAGNLTPIVRLEPESSASGIRSRN